MCCLLKELRAVFYSHPLPGTDSLSGLTKASVRRVNNWCHWFGKRKTVTLPLYDLSAPIRAGPKGARSKVGWGGISWVVLPGDPQTVSADKIYAAQFQVLL